MHLLFDIAFRHLAGRRRQTIVSLIGVSLGVGFFIAIAAMSYRNAMFGSDYPHLEGTFGHTQETLRGLGEDLPEDVRHSFTRGSFEELFPHVSSPPA